MSLLVRKVAKAKWLEGDAVRDPISADAITSCLRTQQNNLSLWRIDDETQLGDAGLALVAGFKKLAPLDVVWIDENELKGMGLQLEKTPGDTIVISLVNTHYDIKGLDYNLLGTVASAVADCFNKTNVKRFANGEVKALIKTAVATGRLDPELLDQKFRIKCGV